MPTVKEFEEFLSHLSNDGYDDLIQSRIARLTPEEQVIAQTRESQRKVRFALISKLAEPDCTEETHEMVFNAIRNMDGDACEHGRSYWKHCLACGKIDHTMFPELFDEDGFHIQDDE